ncbi:DNA polymerase IV [Stratiformator vulcanicus]|uniref:DNA polymerase IV n=1 Tax=Stratiformator vulcanicus TaxID=2527980 RepID=A0A517QXM5_9PLAN|nr:DNA polymerase IV [Stratiformator vulcanicus]
MLHAPAGGGALKVTACSQSAGRYGVRPGLPLAEAQALLTGVQPAAIFTAADPTADREVLEQFALACRRFSPVTGVPPVEENVAEPDSLLIDITGCTHLFGGERPLGQAVIQFFAEYDYQARVAIAATVGVAWAAARFTRSSGHVIAVSAADTLRHLDPLPLAALRVRSTSVDKLKEFDIRTVRDLRTLPRETLPSRFGPELLKRLDQATGDIAEQVHPTPPPEPVRANWEFDVPIEGGHIVEQILKKLTERLLKRLRPGIGMREVRWEVLPPEGTPLSFNVGTARPTVDPDRFMNLVRLKLERMRLPEEIERIAGEVTVREPLKRKQSDLFGDGEQDRDREFADLIECLSGRLGDLCVSRTVSTGHPIPERAFQEEPAVKSPRLRPFLPTTKYLSPTARPTCLLKEPEAIRVWSIVPDGPPYRFIRRGRTFDIRRRWGPERIESAWWTGHEIRRDYWRVETVQGERYWLFQDLKHARSEWFLHGLFE